MKKPEKFPRVLFLVMIGITVVFTSMGALGYAAFGSKTETVVILNLPQDSKFVNGVQFLYSLAILLSTPLQLFPAIRIMENGIFTRSGKANPLVKWQKNIFRCFVVLATALISWGGADDLDKFVALIGSFAWYVSILISKEVTTKDVQYSVSLHVSSPSAYEGCRSDQACKVFRYCALCFWLWRHVLYHLADD